MIDQALAPHPNCRHTLTPLSAILPAEDLHLLGLKRCPCPQSAWATVDGLPGRRRCADCGQLVNEFRQAIMANTTATGRLPDTPQEFERLLTDLLDHYPTL